MRITATCPWQGGLLALALLLVAMAFAPTSAAARGFACERWGDREPSELTLDKARRAIRCLVNDRRIAAGVPMLDRRKKLGRAAQAHSRHMRKGFCFSHRCAGEPDLDGRLYQHHYLNARLTRWKYGENLFYGFGSWGTPRDAVAGWMESPGHRATLLDPELVEIGVGFARGWSMGGIAPAGIYTTNFGLRDR